MDERSQHGYPAQQPQQQLSPEHAHAMPPHHAAPSPWPSYAQPQHGAPIAGHAPYPGPGGQAAPAPGAPTHLPSMQQFQYAGAGYVLPGAPADHGAPMSSHGGTIGMPQPPMAQPHGHAQQFAHQQQSQAHPHAAQHHAPPAAPQFAQHAMQQGMQQAPLQYAAMPSHAPQHPAGMPHYGAGATAPAFDPNAQPQAWAFPTPQGLQLVQPGGAPAMHAAQGAPAAARMARRMKWETIVPIAAVLLLVVAIGVFVYDFDRMTGRDGSAPSTETTKQVDADPAGTSEAAAPPAAETPDVQATVDQAQALFTQGKFDEAADMLHPVLDGPSPDPAAMALHDKVDSANAREDALLKRLAGERRGKRWTAVVGTIGQIEQLRPLDRQLVSLRSRARAAAKQAKAKAAAKAEAAKLAAQRAAAAPSTQGGGAAGGHTGHKTPPVAGGNMGASTGARPPANVPKGSIPQVPNVPNPTGGAGAGVVGGGQAAETMCDVRAPRHAGEDHGAPAAC